MSIYFLIQFDMGEFLGNIYVYMIFHNIQFIGFIWGGFLWKSIHMYMIFHNIQFTGLYGGDLGIYIITFSL